MHTICFLRSRLKGFRESHKLRVGPPREEDPTEKDKKQKKRTLSSKNEQGVVAM
jgi:hypothetical protein